METRGRVSMATSEGHALCMKPLFWRLDVGYAPDTQSFNATKLTVGLYADVELGTARRLQRLIGLSVICCIV